MNAVVASGVPGGRSRPRLRHRLDRLHQGPRRAGRRRAGRVARADRRGLALQADDGRRDAPGGRAGGRRAARARPPRRAPRRGPRQRAPPRRGPGRDRRRRASTSARVETNIVVFEVADAYEVCGRLWERGVQVAPLGPQRLRAVTHLDVDARRHRARAGGVSSGAGRVRRLKRARTQAARRRTARGRRSRSPARAPETLFAITAPTTAPPARQHPDREPVPPPHVAVAVLAPGAHDRDRDDREQRRRLRVELGLAQEERQRRHEQDAAADAEQAADRAGREAQQDRGELGHPISSSIATATSRTANISEIAPAGDALLQRGPGQHAGDGGQRRRAGPCRRRRCRRRRGSPPRTAAITAIAASEVPVATCSRYPNHRTSSGTITVPPPTPNRPLNRPGGRADHGELRESAGGHGRGY